MLCEGVPLTTTVKLAANVVQADTSSKSEIQSVEGIGTFLKILWASASTIYLTPLWNSTVESHITARSRLGKKFWSFRKNSEKDHESEEIMP